LEANLLKHYNNTQYDSTASQTNIPNRLYEAVIIENKIRIKMKYNYHNMRTLTKKRFQITLC